MGKRLIKSLKLSMFLTPQWAFVVIGSIFGILFLVARAPFGAPDEPAHFFRAFQISQGQIVAQKASSNEQCEESYPDGYVTPCVGGNIPDSVIKTAFFNRKHLLSQPIKKLDIIELLSLFDLPSQSQNYSFISFQNTALYSPICYFPQALGIVLGKILQLPPIALAYLGSFFNLAFWVIMGYLSLKIIPFFRWVLFLLLLTPMAIFQAASLSADVPVNGLSVLFIANCSKLSFSDAAERVNVKHLFSLFAIAIAIALAKSIYLPLIFLLLAIPYRKFGSFNKYIVVFLLLLFVCTIATAIWSFKIEPLKIPLNPFQPGAEQSVERQVTFIFKHPLQYAKTYYRTLVKHSAFCVESFIGRLGRLDTRLPIVFIASYLLIIAVAAVSTYHKEISIQLWQKSIVLTLSLTMLLLIPTVLYLVWTPVGYPIIKGLQGRYFIPIAPLFVLLLYNTRIQIDISQWKKWIAAYSLFSGTLTTVVLLNRYYLG